MSTNVYEIELDNAEKMMLLGAVAAVTVSGGGSPMNTLLIKLQSVMVQNPNEGYYDALLSNAVKFQNQAVSEWLENECAFVDGIDTAQSILVLRP